MNSGNDGFWDKYAAAVNAICEELNWRKVNAIAEGLVSLRGRRGRLFILGLGGSAGNASHMVNDVRKLAGIEAYAPTDNVSELTARINDDGWGNAFVGWLKASRLSADDAVFVLSVGGGNTDMGVSTELVHAVDHAKTVGSQVYGIVGRDGGYTAMVGDLVVIVPEIIPALVTPLSEAFQAVIWHGIVSHPKMAVASAHWESLTEQ